MDYDTIVPSIFISLLIGKNGRSGHHQGDGSAGGFKGEREGCPLSWFTLSPDFSPMAAYDSFDCCKTDPGPFELFWFMKSLEGFEDLVCILHVKSNPVIPYIIECGGVFDDCPYLDPGLFGIPGEFYRISDKVFIYLPKHHRIRIAVWQFPDADLDLPVWHRLKSHGYDLP